MSNRYLALAPWIAVVLFSTCTTREQIRDHTQSEEPSARPQSGPLARYEANFDPSDYDEEIEEAQKPRDLEGHRGRSEAEQDSVIVESEFAQGFRIQIFATPSIDEANAMRMTAVQKVTEDSIYVVFDPPVYKVRLGDFRTRMEANKRLASLIETGFPDAWVVSDRIVQRKFTRVRALELPRRED